MEDKNNEANDDTPVTASAIATILFWLFLVGASYAWMAGAERTAGLALAAVGTSIGGTVGAILQRPIRGAVVGYILTTAWMLVFGLAWET